MMNILLADVRDYVATLGIVDDEHVYVGLLPDKKEKSIGIYQQKPRPKKENIGCEASYGVKPVTILLHWTESQPETEQAAYELYEKLEGCRNVTVNNKKLKYSKMTHEEPIDVGPDEKGIFEMVIELEFYYNK